MLCDQCNAAPGTNELNRYLDLCGTRAGFDEIESLSSPRHCLRLSLQERGRNACARIGTLRTRPGTATMIKGGSSRSCKRDSDLFPASLPNPVDRGSAP